MDFELGWKEQIQLVQKPAFCGVPGINKKFNITQDSSPWDIFEIFFSPEMFKRRQKETNRYAKQQINKKKIWVAEGHPNMYFHGGIKSPGKK
jgi:hypothetical protein